MQYPNCAALAAIIYNGSFLGTAGQCTAAQMPVTEYGPAEMLQAAEDALARDPSYFHNYEHEEGYECPNYDIRQFEDAWCTYHGMC